MELIYTILSVFGGYFSWKLTSTPGSKINKKLPKIKIKNIQLLPSVKITIKGKILHIHHWVFLTVLFCISFFGAGWLDSWTTRGFIMGGVLQGLRYPDRGVFKKATIEE